MSAGLFKFEIYFVNLLSGWNKFKSHQLDNLHKCSFFQQKSDRRKIPSGRRLFIASESTYGVIALFSGSDADTFFQRDDEYFAVADVAGSGSADYRVNSLIDEF
eukprot:TRINITY_DN36475_c0_g1_i1.p1 TRINITY_DN36475_c0_g1~~TRINITY_DN36475_c0_g1_i1.p1  ORF type:complete len:104 (+),score=18.04 TRINITY_DN36475_c0_g1_i1:150-461(+)